jgi:serine/threonine protein kinase/Flp pilus assembly protein TadD
MTHSQDHLERVFDAARRLPDGPQREAYLRAACDAEPGLRSEVDALLAAYDGAGSFLAPAAAPRNDDSAKRDLRPDETQTSERSTGLDAAGMTIGRYKVLEKIGEGGFGTVYMAEQQQPLRRMVALKIVKAGMDTRQVVARFDQERQALALMDHPHIAKVFDGGETDSGRPYFVMELVKGVPITAHCDSQRLTVRERLAVFVQVCQAVQHAHQKGLIHRDLKPTNVLVSHLDGRHETKVIDFGIAKAVDRRFTDKTLFTEFHQMVGTPQYMSPEQAIGSLDVDTRSDVYSLGVLLYELVTGATPFDAGELRSAGIGGMQRIISEVEPPRPSTRFATLRQSNAPPAAGAGETSVQRIAEQRRTDPGTLSRLLRGELDWIAMKCLEKDRARRYASAADLAADVQRYLADQPVQAGPPGTAYRVRKFVRRHRAASIAAALGLMIALGSATMLRQIRLDSRERRETHTRLLAEALDAGSLLLGQAMSAPVGRRLEWDAVQTAAGRVSDLLTTGPTDEATADRADAFLRLVADARSDRELAEQIEDVVIVGATHQDRESWLGMEQRFRELFRARGIDLDTLDKPEITRRIRESRNPDKLADALELWLGTLANLPAFGAKRMDKPEWDQFVEVLLASDDDPVRTGIRRLLYSGRRPTLAEVEAITAGVDLATPTPRTMSWLANVYAMAGEPKRGDGVFRTALRYHPDDFMLNFDYAYGLTYQQRWQEAIRYYMRCLALRPEESGIWREMGKALRKTEELEASREALARSIELKPEHAATYVDLAETLIAMGEHDAAVTAAKQAMDRREAYAQAYGCLGRALMEKGDLDEAHAALTECRRLDEADRLVNLPSADWLAECERRIAERDAPPFSPTPNP